MNKARAGLAYYNHGFYMFASDDPLKINEYLSEGLCVVASSATDNERSGGQRGAPGAQGIVAAAPGALTGPPPSRLGHRAPPEKAERPLFNFRVQFEGGE